MQRSAHDREHEPGARGRSSVAREQRRGRRRPAYGEGEPPLLGLGVPGHDAPAHHVRPLLGRVHIDADVPRARARGPALHAPPARCHDADATSDRLHGLVEREANYERGRGDHDAGDTAGVGDRRGHLHAEIGRIGPDKAGVRAHAARDGEHREKGRHQREGAPRQAAQAPATSTDRAGTAREAWPIRSTRPAATRQARPALMKVT